MRLHYDSACCHNDMPTTPMRLLLGQERYAAAEQEISRLNALQLDPSQRLLLNMHEVCLRLQQRQADVPVTLARLELLSQSADQLNDDEFTADFRTMRIGIISRHCSWQLAVSLLSEFFAGIQHTPITDAHWRMAQAHLKFPRDAIALYVTVLFNLESVDAPCLREMAARHQAWCLRAIGDVTRAVAVLRHVGLPASVEPAQEEISLADLLVLPQM